MLLRLRKLLLLRRYAWLLFLFYLGAFGFYLYVRITKTLDLGKYFQWCALSVTSSM